MISLGDGIGIGHRRIQGARRAGSPPSVWRFEAPEGKLCPDLIGRNRENFRETVDILPKSHNFSPTALIFTCFC